MDPEIFAGGEDDVRRIMDFHESLVNGWASYLRQQYGGEFMKNAFPDGVNSGPDLEFISTCDSEIRAIIECMANLVRTHRQARSELSFRSAAH
jgi:hypothetical protein